LKRAQLAVVLTAVDVGLFFICITDMAIDFRKLLREDLIPLLLNLTTCIWFVYEQYNSAPPPDATKPDEKIGFWTWAMSHPGFFFTVVVIFLFGLGLTLITNRRKTLKFGAPEFYEFFENWYNKEGHLYISCSDLDWIPVNSRLFDILLNKAKRKQLSMYLDEHRGDTYARLKENCECIFTRVKTDFPNIFSLNIDNEHTGMIIRYKKNLDDIYVEEYSVNENRERSLIELGKALIK
jgi:hypothetical protein